MRTIFKFLLIVGAMLSWHATVACICGHEAKDWSIKTVNLNIKNNNLIFIGEVIKAEGESYSFKVIDVFKGSIASDTIYGQGGGIGSCSMIPNVEGLWVVYTNADEKGVIDLTFCNLSRSLTTLSPGLIKTDKELSVALREWAQEYAMLASLKKKQPVTVSLEEVTTEEKNASNSGLLIYVAIALALAALFVALLKK